MKVGHNPPLFSGKLVSSQTGMVEGVVGGEKEKKELVKRVGERTFPRRAASRVAGGGVVGESVNERECPAHG